MGKLIDKTINELRKLAKQVGVKTTGKKADIVARLEGDEAPKAKKPGTLGVKPTPIKKTLASRQKAADKDRADLEKRMKKRGSYVGSPH